MVKEDASSPLLAMATVTCGTQKDQSTARCNAGLGRWPKEDEDNEDETAAAKTFAQTRSAKRRGVIVIAVIAFAIVLLPTASVSVLVLCLGYSGGRASPSRSAGGAPILVSIATTMMTAHSKPNEASLYDISDDSLKMVMVTSW